MARAVEIGVLIALVIFIVINSRIASEARNLGVGDFAPHGEIKCANNTNKS